MKHLLAFVIAVGLMLSGASVAAATAPTAARFVDRDCSDFSTQAAAQRFYLNAGGPQRDPHRLDSEGDGVACETRPCPCSRAQSTSQPGPSTTPQPPRDDAGGKALRQRARIISVVDGDTVKVRLAGGALRSVRLLGIDTPEVYGGVECGGREASAAAKRLLPGGTRVVLVSDPSQANKDRYGRLLRYVVKGKQVINATQLRNGWATVYVYQNKPFQRTAGYKKIQAAAKAAKRGIWGKC